MKKTIIAASLGLLFQQLYASNNPASTTYVDDAIAALHTALTYTAGPGITISGNVISGNYVGSKGLIVTGNVINGYNSGTGINVDVAHQAIEVKPKVKIGDLYQGGVVAYVENADASGYGQHGLTISIIDVPGSPTAWASTDVQKSNVYIGANGIGSGLINTSAMMSLYLTWAFMAPSVNQYTGYAGYITSAYSVEANGTLCNQNSQTPCYGEWYLPSPNELLIVRGNLSAINTGITTSGGTQIDQSGNYWSSMSQFGNAFSVNMTSGDPAGRNYADLWPTRAMRQF